MFSLRLTAGIVAAACAGAASPAGAADLAPEPVLQGASSVGPIDYVMVERGRPRPVIDGVGWVLGIPQKLLLWDHRADNHHVSEKTEARAVEYLSQRDVDGVLVRVNQYDPFGEWRRLTQNELVGAGWRYTVGGLYTLGYTIVPGRLFGGDSYNPFTNTISVYSDIPSLAMEQAAYAEDVQSHDHPGGYAALQSLPLIGLIHETKNKHAVFDFVDSTGDPELQAEARKVLYPQLGSEVGGQVGVIIPQAQVIPQIAGAAIGHAVGRREAREVTEGARSVDGPQRHD